MKKQFTDYLLCLYFSSIGILTLFNTNGHTPIPLLIAIALGMCILGSLAIRGKFVYPFFPEDIFFVFYLLASVSSVFVYYSTNELNINHLYAEFVIIIFYYVVIKLSVFNTNYFGVADNFYFPIFIGAVVVSSCGFVDYLLLTRGVNMADYLPMNETNVAAGTGLFSRARSFLPEPTNYALCLNSLFPVLIFKAVDMRYWKTRLFLIIFYVLALMTTFSAAGFFSLCVSASIVFFISFLSNFRFSSTDIWFLVRSLILIAVVAVGAVTFLGEIFVPIVSKITFSEESASAVARFDAYARGVNLFTSDWVSILIGKGTGYVSAQEYGSTHNWWLSVLAEKGLVGFSIIIFVMCFNLIRIMKIRSKVRYGLLISFIATMVHYNAETGFYMPYLWLLLVCSQYQYYNERRSWVMVKQAIPAGM